MKKSNRAFAYLLCSVLSLPLFATQRSYAAAETQANSGSNFNPNSNSSSDSVSISFPAPTEETEWIVSSIRIGSERTGHGRMQQTLILDPTNGSFTGHLGCGNEISNGSYMLLADGLGRQTLYLSQFISTMKGCAISRGNRIVSDPAGDRLAAIYAQALTLLSQDSRRRSKPIAVSRRVNQSNGRTVLTLGSETDPAQIVLVTGN